ncbi:MAG TPA: ComF family protein [Candidatus Sulfotelmatobacter sp.]|nr:ComF family protein [Candidatus Sulfotelmatobacter sp.]
MLRTWAIQATESLFAVLVPSDCRLCGAPLIRISRLPVCDECLAAISPLTGNVCNVCGERVLAAYAFEQGEGEVRCPKCQRLAPAFDRAVAYGSYDDELRELIHLLKFGGVRPAAKVLGRMLAESFSRLNAEFESLSDDETVAVIPVPLHRRKLRQRGFNQAELIARTALKNYSSDGSLRLAPGVLVRQRETVSQIGLTNHQRRENLRGAFAVVHPEQVADRDVLLVDDVLTTGTTVSECARVLRRAGARRVLVATVARTLKMASKYVDIEAGDEVGAEKAMHFARAAGE